MADTVDQIRVYDSSSVSTICAVFLNSEYGYCMDPFSLTASGLQARVILKLEILSSNSSPDLLQRGVIDKLRGSIGLSGLQASFKLELLTTPVQVL